MKTTTLAVIFSLGIAGLAGCAASSKSRSASASHPAAATPATPAAASQPAGTNAFASEMQRVSYAIGMTLGHNFQAQGVDVDPAMLLRGIKDQQGGTTLLTPQEMHETLMEFQKTLVEKQRQMREEAAATNKIAGEKFLAGNKTKPGVVTLPDGLQYLVITNGDGAKPVPGDIVTVNYRGTLVDGKEFDSSYSRGKPAQFPVTGVIPGWTEALTNMNVGSKWEIFVPSDLAYGPAGRPPVIMPNSTLIFEVELLSTEHPTPPPTPAVSNPPLTSDIIKVPSLEEMKKGAKIEVIKPEDAAKAQQVGSTATNQPAK